MKAPKNIVVAITGASGAVYSLRLIEVLLATGHDVHLSISPTGAQVIHEEMDLRVDLNDFQPADLMLDDVTQRLRQQDSHAAGLRGHRHGGQQCAERRGGPRGRAALPPLSELQLADRQRLVSDRGDGGVAVLGLDAERRGPRRRARTSSTGRPRCI